ncbi:MAG: STAS domain-containing protein [SAR324 cluster bacterium]|nr:STAS domain-containing protein [SAR324 cluster bacterium]
MLKITHKIEDSICLLRIEGQLISDSVEELRKYTDNLLEDKSFHSLLVNFDETEWVDSHGIGVFLEIFRKFQQEKRDLALCHLNDSLSELFAMTFIDTFISIYSTPQEALEKLKK